MFFIVVMADVLVSVVWKHCFFFNFQELFVEMSK